ncbi:MAG: DUF4386 domain-containing protein [Bacteroidota bacterium]
MTTAQYKSLRTAALLYLLMALSAPLSLLYVPGKLIVKGDAAATADLIRGSESLFRLGIASELFHQAIAVFLVLALYRLFKPVDENQARLLVMLGALVSVPIMFLNVLNNIAVLILLSGADFLSVFHKDQLVSLAYLFVRLHEQGINIASIFWGLWLFPFGILVIKSGFIPRILGYLLFVAGVGYVVASFTSLLVPNYAEVVGEITLVLVMAELPILFWLFYRAVRPPHIAEA